MTATMPAETTTTAPAPSAKHGPIQAVRRLGWGVLDQGISSLSNFALGLFVARSFGASNFGAFTLAYITYTFVINAARGLATDPLLVRYSGDVSRRWRRATSAATGTALLVGAAAGVICFLVGLLLPDPLGPVFMALGVGLPALTLQDSFRFAFFATGHGSVRIHQRSGLDRAAGFGSRRAAQQRGRERRSVSARLRGYGCGGCSAGRRTGEDPATPAPGPVVAAVAPSDIGSLSHREPHDQQCGSGALVRAGCCRRSRGRGLCPGLRNLDGTLPRRPHGTQPGRCSRSLTRVPPEFRTPCTLLFRPWWFSGCGCRRMGVAHHHDLPARPWTRPTQGALDANFTTDSCDHLTVAAASFTTAATAGLRAMGVARRSLRAQLTGSTAYAICGATGAILGGALGASWGVATAQVFAALVWWHQLRSALADHHAVAEVAR